MVRVARFSQAEFHAASVRSLGLNRYVATGMLRLKGIEQSVEVPFAWTDADDGATMEGQFTIKRAPYGTGVREWAR